MIQLNGGAQPIALGSNLTLRAPGLKGTARVLPPVQVIQRDAKVGTEALDAALDGAGFVAVNQVELSVNLAPMPPAAAAMRGPEGADAFELEVGAPPADHGQVVLAIDEAGAMHWHFALDDDLALQPATTRGGGGPVCRYRIPKEVATLPPGDAAQATTRSVFGLVGRKLLKVLIYPLGDALFGPVIDKAIGYWEGKKRPHRIGHYRSDSRAELAPTDWATLSQGPALLWVHGTFSTSKAAFGDLDPAALDTLTQRYAGRSFAFDHPSLSASPTDNARWFFSQMPADARLEVDIVCHSRGGLVSRLLADPAALGVDPQRFKVRRLVLVGVPNAGTPLAQPDHMVAFLDRMTTAINLKSVTPDWTDVLEAVMAVVKVVGHAGLVKLDGLQAMNPDGDFVQTLDTRSLPATTLYGIGADFEPQSRGLAAAFCKGADVLVDRIFDEAPNDLVVPTVGMRVWGGAQQVPDDRYLAYPASRGVMHTDYFGQPETAQHLLAWLG